MQYSGLDSRRVKELQEANGYNVLDIKKVSVLSKMFKLFKSPVSFMLLAAAGLSLAIGKLADFYIIIALFFSNIFIGLWHEHKADTSIEKLESNLTTRIEVLRDDTWKEIDTKELVVGDIIKLRIGDIVPADVEVKDGANISLDQSALTGESLPQDKKVGDSLYSGSFLTTGEAIAKVTATGSRTNFGKTLSLIDRTPRRSSLEKDIISISKFVSIISLIVVILLTVVLLFLKSNPLEVVTLDLSLMIAGIPVALPTVMSLIISVGVLELSKKNAVVRRLASLEDLSNVDFLLSDKTGTLTKNKISVNKVIALGKYPEEEVIALAAVTSTDSKKNPLDKAVYEESKRLEVSVPKQVEAIPADSVRKRNTAKTVFNGKDIVISFGAPQVIFNLCKVSKEAKVKFDEIINEAAKSGFRPNAVAINESKKGEEDMELVGLVLFADELRADAKETLSFMRQNGIGIRMVTGDNIEIAERTADEVGLNGKIFGREVFDDGDEEVESALSRSAGFAEVLPKDKLKLVQVARKHYVVAVTGDGVNDVPAVKAADVGLAVRNAVDSLKSTADIVLLTSGISVIRDAIIEARKIFVRLYNYSLYRISESFRLIITIAVIGVLYKTFPLTPVQLIVLAFLNDLPIVSLAFDRVKTNPAPSKIDSKARFTLSTLFGMVGTANSLFLFFIMTKFLHLSWSTIQTIFFLKLTVSGHMLVYVAHTKERWYRFLPSRQVILATTATQLLATFLALFGIFTAKIGILFVVLVWLWSFGWMQVAELAKYLQAKRERQLA